MRCGAGSTCELLEVVCVRAPCDPIPTCVPVCDKPCSRGQHCELDARSRATCVKDAPGVKACGNATCAAGMTCCNASCGMCAPPGAACAQIACF